MSNKWVAFQPLIGGMMIGAEKAFGCKPACVVSFEGFLANDRHYLKYLWSKGDIGIPYYVIDGKTGELKDVLIPDGNFNPISVSEEEPTDWDRDMWSAIMMENFQGTNYVVSVPVCAGLSGLNRKADANHPHNDNMLNIFKWSLENIKPLCMVGENAMEFSKNRGDVIRGKLTDVALAHGYKFSYCLTSTSFCGLPQNRTRSFFWMTKDAGLIPIPPPAEKGYPTLEDMFRNMTFAKDDPMHNVEWATKAFYDLTPAVSFVKAVYPEQNWRNWARRCGFNDSMLRSNLIGDCLAWIQANRPDDYPEYKKMSDKVNAGFNVWNTGVNARDDHVNALHGKSTLQYVHPFADRLFTNRELMKLLGMPDDMSVVPGKGENEGSIRPVFCQNVPVNTAEWACRVMLYAGKPGYQAQCNIYFVDFIKQFGRVAPDKDVWLRTNHPEIFAFNKKIAAAKAEQETDNDDE